MGKKTVYATTVDYVRVVEDFKEMDRRIAEAEGIIGVPHRNTSLSNCRIYTIHSVPTRWMD